jgi:hypothetical protein
MSSKNGKDIHRGVIYYWWERMSRKKLEIRQPPKEAFAWADKVKKVRK